MSEWLHIRGTFVCSPNAILGEYPISVEDVCGILDLENGTELRPPGFGSVIESLLWADFEGVLRLNPLRDCAHSILLDNNGLMYEMPIMLPRPYGSEGFGNMDANLYIDRASWSWWYPMFSCSTHAPGISVSCDMNLRDRGKDATPYVRLWWNLLNIWLDVRSLGLVMETWNYREKLDPILWYGLVEEDLPKAKDVLAHFYKVCQEYDEYYLNETNKAEGACLQAPRSFQDWYNHVYVPEHGEGPVVRGAGEDLV